MSGRRTWIWGLVLLVGFAVVGASVPVPLVAIGRGPTYDTLGQFDGRDVISFRSMPTYLTSGHLNMTTVSVTSRLTIADALSRWALTDYKVVPRDAVFPPGESDSQASERSREQFTDSQANAEGAALSFLGLPATVLVDQLTTDSPSAGSLEAGDVLTTVNGSPLTTFRDLAAALAPTRPGQQISVGFVRGDSPTQLAVVTLGTRADGPQGALGVVPAVRPTSDDEIVISLGDIGGPSAGLMFALAVVDKLTPGELAGGRFVAGTGTITSTGLVGKIDGIPFKMLAASEAGASVFLTPAANCEEAVATAPSGLQLVKVADLEGAVDSLDALNAGNTPPGC